MFFRKRAIALFVVLGVVFISLACSVGNLIPGLGENPTATPADAVLIQPSDVVPTISAVTPTALPLRATSTLAPSRASSTPATLQTTQTSPPALVDIQSGLDKLDSYQMDFQVVLEGKDPNGKDVKQNLSLFQEIIKSKDSMHLKMEGSGMSTNQASGAIETFQVGKIGYLLALGENQTAPTCISYSSDSPMVDLETLSPAEMLGQIKEQTLIAKGETVNGVKTDHYKIMRGSWGIGKVTSEDGDAWVAQDGNYLVRYTGQAKGEFELTADLITGTMTWTVNLTRINQVGEITLAPECVAASQASQDIPIPANATDQNTFGDIITFNTPDEPKVVADFFRSELPVKGWKIDKDSALGTTMVIKISKDDRVLTIMVTPGTGDKGSSVTVTKAQ